MELQQADPTFVPFVEPFVYMAVMLRVITRPLYRRPQDDPAHHGLVYRDWGLRTTCAEWTASAREEIRLETASPGQAPRPDIWTFPRTAAARRHPSRTGA